MGFLSNLFGDKPLPPPPKLPFECIVVRGREALERREALLSGREKPVILGDPVEAARFEELLKDSPDSVQSILERARGTHVDEWMGIRAAEEAEYFNAPAGEWPTGTSTKTEIAAHRDVLTRRPLRAVAIGLVPASDFHEVPAHVRYGGWNECPPPEIHVAMHKRWQDRYGARIASMTFDVIECTVERPPESREDAMVLAREQFIYCPDIVHQGVETVENLAATLRGSRTWYFWWD